MDYVILEPLNVGEPRLAGITVAVLEERVKNHVQFFWTVVAFLVAWLGVGTYFLVDMRGDVKVLLRPQNLVKAASTPDDPKSQGEAKKIIAEAQNSAIPLPQAVVEQTGKKFVDAGDVNSGAWQVALGYLRYRSTLNESSLASYHWAKVNDPYKSNLAFRGNEMYITRETVPCSEGSIQARIIDLPGSETGKCSEYILFLGGQVPALDGNHFKNTIFKNVKIAYEGGPLILENVTFINCTFDLPKPNARSIQLASAILELTSVTFKSLTASIYPRRFRTLPVG